MMKRRMTILGKGESKVEAVRAATIIAVFSLHGYTVEYTRVQSRADVLWVLDPGMAHEVEDSRLIVYDDIYETKTMWQEAGALILNRCADVIIRTGALITRNNVRDSILDVAVANDLMDDVVDIARGLVSE